MAKPIRIPNVRHNVKSTFARNSRKKRLTTWLAARGTALSYTAKEIFGRMALVGSDAMAKATTIVAVARNKPTITGTPTTGQTLTAVAGTWGGTPAPTITRQWYADNVAIGGATATTLVLAAGQTGKKVTVEEIATNSAGVARQKSLPTATIA